MARFVALFNMPPRTRANAARIANLHHPSHSAIAPPASSSNKKTMKISGKLLAYAILVEGGNYEEITRIFRHVGIAVVGHSAYYEAQAKVCKKLIEMGKNSINYWLSQIEPETVICIDGCWDHKRDGRHCVTSVIDNKNWKIIEIEMKTRGEENANYNGPANGMEAACIRDIIPRLKSYEKSSNITAYCHDCDGRVSKIFRDNDWDLTELLDLNHAMLCFAKDWEKLNVQYNRILDGLFIKMKLWAYHCISLNESTDVKVAQFRNAIAHYSGDHTNCIHPRDHEDYITKTIDDAKTKEVLEIFINQNIYIIEQCNPIANTQRNESFNNTRARYALKTTRWDASFEARTMVAVLEVNRFGEDWRSELRNILKLPPLTPDLQDYFNSLHIKKVSRSQYRRTPDYQETERLRRLNKKKKNEQLRKMLPEYNINHVPRFHMIDKFEELYMLSSLSTEVKSFFIQIIPQKKTLVEVSRSFIKSGLSNSAQNRKSFFAYAPRLFGVGVRDVQLAFDRSFVDQLDEISRKDGYVLRMQQLWNVPNLLTEKASNFITENNITFPDIPDASNRPKFVSHMCKVTTEDGEQFEKIFMFPNAQGSSDAFSSMEGTIIHVEESPYYPLDSLCMIANAPKEIIFASKNLMRHGISANACVNIFKEGTGLRVCMMKSEKSLNPATGRMKKTQVRRGEIVVFEISDYIFNMINE